MKMYLEECWCNEYTVDGNKNTLVCMTGSVAYFPE